jgi:hypothetical protein
MADHAADGDIFIYRGMRAPQHIINAIVDKSVEVIEDDAFAGCVNLVNVETHDGITKVGCWSFYRCKSLRRINLKSVVEIGDAAFHGCENLEEVEFGDKLARISNEAFSDCTSLRRLKLPSIITIGTDAFFNCRALTDIELLSERLVNIGECAFFSCERLQSIAIPLKRDLFSFDYRYRRCTQFDNCFQLATVDLVGVRGIRKTVASLHMECWRIDMIAEIDRINQVLPTTPANEKTAAIKQWMDSVMDKMDHYKAEHHRYVKEALTLLELSLWKAKLGEKEENHAECKTKKAKIDVVSARKERRITSGADIVIKNVLPFLQLG